MSTPMLHRLEVGNIEQEEGDQQTAVPRYIRLLQAEARQMAWVTWDQWMMIRDHRVLALKTGHPFEMWSNLAGLVAQG